MEHQVLFGIHFIKDEYYTLSHPWHSGGVDQFPSTSSPRVAGFVSWTAVSSVFICQVKLLPLAVAMVNLKRSFCLSWSLMRAPDLGGRKKQLLPFHRGLPYIPICHL